MANFTYSHHFGSLKSTAFTGDGVCITVWAGNENEEFSEGGGWVTFVFLVFYIRDGEKEQAFWKDRVHFVHFPLSLAYAFLVTK